MTQKQKNSKAGFTMVEIIAVLVIIGIMAAVAAPKFINMGKTARQKVAVAGISEAKAMLSAAYAKSYLINNGTEPTIANITAVVLDETGATALTDMDFGDVRVDIVASGTTGYTITVDEYDTVGWSSTAWGAAPSDTWTKPVQ